MDRQWICIRGRKLLTTEFIHILDSYRCSFALRMRDTEYEINNEDGGLVPKTITEKLILEIPVAMSQMSAFACKKPCEKVKIDRTRISQQQIVLICGEKCEENKADNEKERNCNFLCQWFNVKNDYLIREIAALKEYLRRNVNN